MTQIDSRAPQPSVFGLPARRESLVQIVCCYAQLSLCTGTDTLPSIELAIHVAAPPDRCFDIARSVDWHVRSGRATQERAVGGVTHGLLELGDTVTWRARHLGVTQYLTSQISVFDRPRHFRDSQVRGAFHRFDHDHYFEVAPDGGTVLRDIFDFEAPLGWLGRLAERLFLTEYMRRFLTVRALAVKAAAESTGAH
jgi:ligand-binding SRPBCC domain-containing protein